MSYCNAVTANGRYIIAGLAIISSEDRVHWRVDVPAGEEEFASITYGGGLLIAGGLGSGVRESRDEVNWAKVRFPDRNFWGVAGGLGEFVAVNSSSGIMQRTGEAQWTRAQQQAHWFPWGVTYGGGYFIAVGAQNVILRAKVETPLSFAIIPNAADGMVSLELRGKSNLSIGLEDSTDLET